MGETFYKSIDGEYLIIRAESNRVWRLMERRFRVAEPRYITDGYFVLAKFEKLKNAKTYVNGWDSLCGNGWAEKIENIGNMESGC